MISDYYDFFIFLGGVLIIGGIIYFLFRHSLQNIFISEEEMSKLKVAGQVSAHEVSLPKIGSQASLLSKIRLAIIIGGFLFNQFLMWRMDSSGIISKLLNISITFTKK